MWSHAGIAQINFIFVEEFTSLNGMTLFELSRRPPAIIRVCQAINKFIDKVYPSCHFI
jgi:hypothetical protein